MSKQKQARIRHRALDRCLKSPKKYYMEGLVEACSQDIGQTVSRRTVYQDLLDMEEEYDNCFISRVYDGQNKVISYKDKSYSIINQPITTNEANQLKEALFTLSRFKGMPQFEWVEEILVKLDSGFDISKTNNRVIEYQQNESLKGKEYITQLYEAITFTKSLTIKYKSFTQTKEETFVLHPYYLKQFNNRWFIFGKKDGTDFPSSHYALDRIIEIKDSKKKYIPNKTIEFEDYFFDFVGVTENKKNPIEEVVLKVKNTRLPYIETKPLHGSQSGVIDRGKTHSLVTLKKIRRNPELEALILSYGDDIEVVKPISFRNEIKKKIASLHKAYEE